MLLLTDTVGSSHQLSLSACYPIPLWSPCLPPALGIPIQSRCPWGNPGGGEENTQARSRVWEARDPGQALALPLADREDIRQELPLMVLKALLGCDVHSPLREMLLNPFPTALTYTNTFQGAL